MKFENYYTRRIEIVNDECRYAVRYDCMSVAFYKDGKMLFEMSAEENEIFGTLMGAAAKHKKEEAAARKPVNAGQPWTPELDNICRRLFAESMSIKDIAEAMERSRGAIRSRLVRLGLLVG